MIVWFAIYTCCSTLSIIKPLTKEATTTRVAILTNDFPLGITKFSHLKGRFLVSVMP